MTKPWEQTLSLMQFDSDRRCLVEDGTRMVAIIRNYDSAEWEPFLVSSPPMARALKRLLLAFPTAHATDEEAAAVAEARLALREAGVPLESDVMTSTKPGEHAWSAPEIEDIGYVKRCTRSGCSVRATTMGAVWQRKERSRWIDSDAETIPPCAGK